ncbi:hypothetical protein [Sphingomonas sp. J315]|nr:hypothetical protein [Sphingomonas sp. J315]UUY00572.1 hypothetical protein LRS08_05665 [Sphingomonas sp. J315]
MVTKPEYWWRDYLIELISDGDPMAAVEIADGLLDVRKQEDRPMVELFLNRLNGEAFRTKSEAPIDLGWRVYSSAYHQAGLKPSILRDGGFERESRLPVFEWALVGDIDLGSAVVARPDDKGGRALALTAYGGRSGEVARQILKMGGGRYRLSLESGGFGATAPDVEVRIVCNKVEPGRDRVVVRVPRGEATVRSAPAAFAVPAGCDWAWLIVNASSRAPSQESMPWIDSINVERVK